MQTVLFGGDPGVRSTNLSILKLRPGHALHLVLGLNDPVWCSTHFLKRQYFCGGEHCPLCAGHQARVQGFMPAIGVREDRRRPILLELSPAAWDRAKLSARMQSHDLAAGREVEISRSKSRSPLRIETCETKHAPPAGIGDPLYVLSAVALIHGIRGVKPDETLADWQAATAQARCQLLQRAM